VGRKFNRFARPDLRKVSPDTNHSSKS
jgi:hypothetical protein